MKKRKMNNKAVASPLEFATAFGVIMIVFLFLFAALSQVFVIYDVDNSDYSSKAMLVSEKLLKDLGKTVDGNTEWYSDPGNITDLGLAQEAILYEALRYDNGSMDVLVNKLPQGDLSVNNLDYAPKNNLNHGDTITATYNIKNVGNDVVNGYLWNVFLGSTDHKYGFYQETVQPGQTISMSVKMVVPLGVEYSYPLKVEVYPYYSDDDQNLKNNYDSTTVHLGGYYDEPDLGITSLDYSPKQGLDNGESITVTFTVSNINGVDTDGFDWTVYLNGVIKDSGVHSQGLNVGESVDFNGIKFSIPNNGASSHTLKAAIVPHGEDSLSGNNEKSESVSTTGSDPSNPVSPDVDTLEEAYVDETSAIVRGNLTSMGSYSSLDIGFMYREAPTNPIPSPVPDGWGEWKNVTATSPGSTAYGITEFSRQLTGLTADTLYEYKAWAEMSSGSRVYGEIKEFRTKSDDMPAELVLSTGSAKYTKGAVSSTLNVKGSVSGSFGTGSNSHDRLSVWFEWIALDINGSEVDSGTSESVTFYKSDGVDFSESVSINDFVGKWAVRPDFKYRLVARFYSPTGEKVGDDWKTYNAALVPGVSLKVIGEPTSDKVDFEVTIRKITADITNMITRVMIWCQNPDGSSQPPLYTDWKDHSLELGRVGLKTIQYTASLENKDLTQGLVYLAIAEAKYERDGMIGSDYIETTSRPIEFRPGAAAPHDPQIFTNDRVEAKWYTNFWGYIGDTGRLGGYFDGMFVGVRITEISGPSLNDKDLNIPLTLGLNEQDGVIQKAKWKASIATNQYSITLVNTKFTEGTIYKWCAVGWFRTLDGTLYIGFGKEYTFTFGEDDGGTNDDGSCFLADTEIIMADDSLKDIEDISVGDKVKSYDTLTDSYKEGLVTEVFHHSPEEMTDYYLVLNNDIRVTPNHPLYVDGRWIDAGELEEGDTWGGTVIESIEKIYCRVPTYNFEVEPYHTYQIAWSGKEGVAHNSINEGGGTGGTKAPQVDTLSATGVDKDSATLRGEITNGATDCLTWFKYAKESDYNNNVWTKTSVLSGQSGNFDYTINNLDSGTKYYYKAYASNGAAQSYGDVKSFTTDSSGGPSEDYSNPNVETKYKTIYGSSIKLEGKLTNKGGASEVKVRFKWSYEPPESCFLAGTKIIMADGSLKNIEDVMIGDKVKSYDTLIDSYKEGLVTEVFHHSPEEMTDYYMIVDGLHVTPNHPIYYQGEWIDAGELEEGDTWDGIPIKSIEKVYSKVPTYNFEVEPYHTYQIAWGDNERIVHNAADKSQGYTTWTGWQTRTSTGYFSDNIDNKGAGEYKYRAEVKATTDQTRWGYGDWKSFEISNCFLEGTMIEMQDGSLKPIEKIEIGDELTAFDEETKTWKTASVEEIYHFPAYMMLVDYYLVINDELRLTPGHYLYSGNEWVKAGSLKIGDILGNEDQQIVVDSIEKIYEDVPLFDLGLDSYHSYKVVLPSGGFIMAHNATQEATLKSDSTYEDSTSSTSTTDSTDSTSTTDSTDSTSTTDDTTSEKTKTILESDLKSFDQYNDDITDDGTTDDGTTDDTDTKFSSETTTIETSDGQIEEVTLEVYVGETSSGMPYNRIVIKQKDDISFGVVNSRKINALENLDYEKAKNALGIANIDIKNYDFNIFIKKENGEQLFFGKSVTSSSDIVSNYVRDMMIYDPDVGTTNKATLTVTIFR